MMPPKRALPELSFDLLIINFHPVVVKLLASKVAIVMYGQTMQTTLDQNEAVRWRVSLISPIIGQLLVIRLPLAQKIMIPYLLPAVPGTRYIFLWKSRGGASLAFSSIDWQWAICRS